MSWQGWLTKAGPIKVEHLVCPSPGVPVEQGAPAAGVLHTMEGSLESGLAVFRQHFAPTFSAGVDRRGRKRILQHMPLGMMAAALEHNGGPATNGAARVQIELAGHCQVAPWLPDPATLDTLTWLMAELAARGVVPLSRPYPDLMPSPPWAVASFVRRLDGKWGHTAGWFGHVEIPGNVHYDPGALEWSTVLHDARVKLRKLQPTSSSSRPATRATPRRPLPGGRTRRLAKRAAKTTPAPEHVWTSSTRYLWLRWWLGVDEFKRFGPRNPHHRPKVPAKVPPQVWAWAEDWCARNGRGR